MKKVLSILLTAALLFAVFTVFTVTVSATTEERSEVIKFSSTSYNAESEHFTLHADAYGTNGWVGGGGEFDECELKISSKDNSIKIKRIEAVIGDRADSYLRVGVTSGTMRERITSVGSTVHVDDINNTYFAYAGGMDCAQFKDITVYYDVEVSDTASALSVDNLWIIIGLAVVVVIGIAVLVVVKKKKKPAPADGVNEEK